MPKLLKECKIRPRAWGSHIPGTLGAMPINSNGTTKISWVVVFGYASSDIVNSCYNLFR